MTFNKLASILAHFSVVTFAVVVGLSIYHEANSTHEVEFTRDHEELLENIAGVVYPDGM